ncbi:MAG: hypothetical protein CL833_06990 [Crocinitomicaceae bacterium]|nr:hypothetical protein [Crocinitomicaceae bacterium]
MSEGAGALGFSRPIESDAESISKQVSRLANQQARQVISQQNIIQKAEEKMEKTLAGFREQAYRVSNYIPSGYSEYIGTTMHDVVDNKLEGMLSYIEETQSPPQELVRDLKQTVNGEREFVNMVKGQETQIKQNKNIDASRVVDMYFNGYIKPLDIPFYEPGAAIGPADWLTSEATYEQIRYAIPNPTAFWKDFFIGKSQIETQRQTQSTIQGGARQTETSTIEVPLSFTKYVNETAVPLSAAELMSQGESGMSMLQVATNNGQDKFALAMIDEQVDIWASTHQSELVEFQYQDANGQTQTYSNTVGNILADPDNLGNQWIQAKGLEEAIRAYGINRSASGVTVSELPPKIIINPSVQRDNADTYAREDDLITTINTIAMGGGNLGDKILKDGKVIYPVNDAIFQTAKGPSGNRVNIFFNPADETFIVVDEKKNILDINPTEENTFRGDELATELRYQGIESGAVAMRMNDSKVTAGNSYTPEALSRISERVDLDTDPTTIYDEIFDNVQGVIGSKTTLEASDIRAINAELKRGGIKTATGTVKGVRINRGEVVVSFEGAAAQSMSMEEFISLINSRQVSAVNRFGQNRSVNASVLDVLRGRQNNIA